VITVGNNVFSACSSLTSVNLPNATTLGNAVFNGNSLLASINLSKMTTLGNSIFQSALAFDGTGSFNSAITASATWDTANNLQRLQAQNWQINYINS
jgi:hypothetical protein